MTDKSLKKQKIAFPFAPAERGTLLPRLGYEYKNTFLHNLHPFSKTILLGSLAILGSTYWDLYFLLPLVFIGYLAYIKTGAPTNWIKKFLKIWFIASMNPASMMLSIFMVNPSLYKVLPEEFVSHVVLQITPPSTPLVGYTAITYGTLYFLASSRIRAPFSFMMGCLLAYTLNPSDFAQAMAGIGIPSHFLFMFTGGHRFTSVFVSLITNVMNALKLRGWEIKSKNPFVVIKDVYPLTGGIGRKFPSIVNRLAIVMEARAFEVAIPVIAWRKIQATNRDYLVGVTSVLFLLMAEYLLIVHNIGMI